MARFFLGSPACPASTPSLLKRQQQQAVPPVLGERPTLCALRLCRDVDTDCLVPYKVNLSEVVKAVTQGSSEWERRMKQQRELHKQLIPSGYKRILALNRRGNGEPSVFCSPDGAVGGRKERMS